MFLAYKYARKKYKEREQRKAELAAEAAQSPLAKPQPLAQENAVGDEQIERLAPAEDNAATVGKELTPPTAKDTGAPTDPNKKKQMTSYRLKVIFGLAAPFALQALDTTIIASALPFIATDFGKQKPFPLPPLPKPLFQANPHAQTRSASSIGLFRPST